MRVRLVLIRLLLFVGAWIVLAEGATHGWPIAALALGAATVASVTLLPAPVTAWRARGAVRFARFFLYQSFVGGVDVARRAFAPPSRILAPVLIRHRLRLEEGPARHFFVAATGLLPGTLTARVEKNEAHVHVLDATLPASALLRALEERTADLFGLPPLA